jgi:ribosomal-protein-alanine N-acetyltransferase
MTKQNALFETERIYIRPFERPDFKYFLKIHQTPKIMKNFFSDVKTTLQAKKKFDFILDHQKKYGFSYWAVCKKDTDEYMGQTGVVTNPDGSVNLCFIFPEKFWGRGYGTETTKATLKYVFEVLDLEKVRAMHTIRNVASGNVLKKSGMKFLGEKFVDRFDVAFYELTKEQYFADKENA